MIFGGFQKLTLLDFPGVVACTLFTKGCNFLCPFCHNAPLVNKPGEAASFSDEGILAYLRKRQGILEGVCITGGEPLLHPELPSFIRRVKELGYQVKLDTNGSFPERLGALVDEGLLNYVAMDIKNAPAKYSLTAGTDVVKMQDVEASIDLLLRGRIPYEFRTTVTAELHTPADIQQIAARIAGADAYYIQNFLDSGNLIAGNNSPVSSEILETMRRAAEPYVKSCKTR